MKQAFVTLCAALTASGFACAGTISVPAGNWTSSATVAGLPVAVDICLQSGDTDLTRDTLSRVLGQLGSDCQATGFQQEDRLFRTRYVCEFEGNVIEAEAVSRVLPGEDAITSHVNASGFVNGARVAVAADATHTWTGACKG